MRVKVFKNILFKVTTTVLVFLCVTLYTSKLLNVNLGYLILPHILIVLLVHLNLKELTTKKYKNIYLGIIGLKYFFLVYQAGTKKIPMGGLDWQVYDKYARGILDTSNSVFDILTNDSRDFFSRVVALIYYFNDKEIVVMYFYIFCTSLLLFNFIIKFSNLIFKDSNNNQLLGLIYSIWPLEFVFSITFLRELPIQLFFMMSIYYYVLFFERRNFLFLILAYICILIASMMHSGMIVVAVSFAFFVSIDIKNKEVKLFSFRVIFNTLTLFLLLRISPLWSTLVLKFNSFTSIGNLVERTQMTAGNTSYVNSGNESLLGMLLQIPHRILMFSLSPLPWQVYSISTLIALVLISIPQWYILYKLYIYFVKVKATTIYEKNLKKIFFLILFSTYTIFALGTQNYGTATRHRMKLFPLEIILVLSVNNLKKKNKINLEYTLIEKTRN